MPSSAEVPQVAAGPLVFEDAESRVKIGFNDPSGVDIKFLGPWCRHNDQFSVHVLLTMEETQLLRDRLNTYLDQN